MLTVSKKVEYGVELLSFMAKVPDKTYSLTEVASRLNLPYRFLGQVAGNLRRSGIIGSKEGVAGGYFLVAGWEDKNLNDVVTALGESGPMVECLGCQRTRGCKMRGVWAKLEKSIKIDLSKIKLSEL